MKGFIGNKATALLKTWFLPTPQKTASGIQAIPHDNRIYVRMWGTGDGWFKTDLYCKWWTNVPDFVKEWRKDDFEEFIMASFGFGGEKDPMFWERFIHWPMIHQRAYIDKFIAAHEPMIRKELEEHYNKHLKHSKQ